MSIERIYRSLKHSRGLEGHCVRGLRKITLHATLPTLTFQATALEVSQFSHPLRGLKIRTLGILSQGYLIISRMIPPTV